jgi:hypothetical protein
MSKDDYARQSLFCGGTRNSFKIGGLTGMTVNILLIFFGRYLQKIEQVQECDSLISTVIKAMDKALM